MEKVDVLRNNSEELFNINEVNAKINQALIENYEPLFNALKIHIDGLITERLIAFRKGIPSISQSTGQDLCAIDHCME